MHDDGSVTQLLRRLKDGDRATAGDAAARLWERYFQELVRLARARLQGVPRRAADEEDVALSAFDSFYRGAEQGRFPSLDNRADLWQLLATITARKAFDAWQYEARAKRGGGRVLDEAACSGLTLPEGTLSGLEGTPARDPSPELAALFAEQLECLLARLGSDSLRAVATLRMDGHSEEEIAGRLDCSARTVRRKLELIREIWAREVGA
jgi:DNA-directed RNA polymerase specialized sigma24 family protein